MTVAAGTDALNIAYKGLLLRVLYCINIHGRVAILRNIPNSRLQCKTRTLFTSKMAKINALCTTKVAEIPYPLRPHIPTCI